MPFRRVLSRWEVNPPAFGGRETRGDLSGVFGILRQRAVVRKVTSAGRSDCGDCGRKAEAAVHRLTGELADWYDIDAGHLRIGDRADLVVVDPEHLDDRLDHYAESPVPQYADLPRMVNRNDDAVALVLIDGRTVVRDGTPTPLLGTERTGSFLRAGQRTQTRMVAHAG